MAWIGRLGGALLVGATLPLALAARAEPAPSAVVAMIAAAAATGDAATLKTVVGLAKKTNPTSAKEIDDQVAALTASAAKARVEKLAHESLFQGIKGEGSIGLSEITGNSTVLNLAAGLKLSKETTHWKNALDLEAEYNKSNHVLADEKFLANYEGDYKFSERFYAFVDLSWTRDSFAGYDGRYIGAVGPGYKLIASPKLNVGLEGGPSVRRTDYVSVLGAPPFSRTNVGGRAAANVAWTITPGTVLTEDASTFVGGGGETVVSTTAITTKLVGALSARLSFLLDYNSQPPLGVQSTDTTTRLSAVYGF